MVEANLDERRATIRSRFRVVWLAPVFAAIALGAWALASPVGASPDDDYHLVSIWCANDSRSDLCAPDPENSKNRLALPGITGSPCFVADEMASGACQVWPADPKPVAATAHGNWVGAYPPLYYLFMNAFASTDIQASALAMRFFNVALFLAFTTTLAWLLPRNLRVPLIAGWTISMVPLAGSLIASNNPGSWAVIGVGSGWLAALGWFRSSGRRSWALGALTVASVVIAAGARTDAAVYSIMGLGIAAFLSFERTRSYALRLLLPVALSVFAAVLYFTSGYATVAEYGLSTGIAGNQSRNQAAILAFNVLSIPDLWTGVFGSWGLGWRMEAWPGFATVEFATLAVFIGLASLGIRAMYARKAIMTTALVATLYILPVYILTVGMSKVGENVQPRYLMPLVVVLAGLLLLTKTERPLMPGRWHVIPAIILLSVANTIALHTNLRRYVTGFDAGRLSLDSGAEWWWSGFAVGPTALWLIGSVAFSLTVVLLGREWLREGRRRAVPV